MDWNEVRPVLDATYQLLREHGSATQEAVCQALDRPPGDEWTIRALALLYENGYIGG